MPTPSTAANAYAALARLTNPSAGASRGLAAEGGEANFGALLKDALGAVV